MERLFRGHRIKMDYFPGNNDYKVTCFKLVVDPESYKLVSEEQVFEYLDTSAEGPYEILDRAKAKVGTILNENK